MPVEDKRLGLTVMRAFTRRASVDASDVRIHTAGGVVYLSGHLKPVRGSAGLDMHKEMEIIERALRSTPGVRDIVNELNVVH